MAKGKKGPEKGKKDGATAASAPVDEPDNEGDFEAFVRSALKSLIDGQNKLSTQFVNLEIKVTENTREIGEIKQSLTFQDGRLTDVEKKSKTLSTSSKSQENHISAMETQIKTLESEVNSLERYTRAFNLRFLNIPESDDENCRVKLGELLEQHFQISGDNVEIAHRTGKKRESGPRHLIARFHSRAVRNEVIRLARTSEPRPPFVVIDDLTRSDLEEKRRVAPAMERLYQQGKRPRFLAGKLYAGGRQIKEGTIEKLLQDAQAVEINTDENEEEED